MMDKVALGDARSDEPVLSSQITMQTYPFGGGHWTCPMLMETNSFGKEYTTTHIHEDETVLQYKKLIHR